MLSEATTGVDEVWSGGGTAWNWRAIDRELRALARRRGALDADEAALLASAVRSEVWRPLGKASLHEYLEEVLGYSPRQATERVRVAIALEDLPELAAALATGELPFSAIRELTRVATRATERAWCDDARGKNLRQIEQAVAGRTRGDVPGDPPDPDLVARPIRFDVRPATLALLRQAQQVLQDERGEQLDDDALISALCTAVLAGSADPESGRARHQILTVVCEACGQGWREGAGAKLALDAADLARAQCDAQRIGSDREPARAVQDVAPKTVRFVHRRDGGRCCVPGCRASRYLEIHHVVPREAGGGHEPENLALLCDGHHRAHHAGALSIIGRAPNLEIHPIPPTHVGPVGLVGRPTPPPPPRPTPPPPRLMSAPLRLMPPSPMPLRPTRLAPPELTRDAELALTTLGFRVHEAKAAVAAALAVEPTASLEALVREALRHLGPPSGRTIPLRQPT